jgi:uncharacterized protein (TIGR02118 family)
LLCTSCAGLWATASRTRHGALSAASQQRHGRFAPDLDVIPPLQEKFMIKVSVMYPATPGARFDHDYYRDHHMALVQARMGAHCKFYTIDKGLAAGGPGEPPPFVAMCHIYCDSVESFQAGFGAHAQEIRADIAKYTDIKPTLQISEVVVGQP